MGEARAARGGASGRLSSLRSRKKALPEVACSDGILVLRLRAAPCPEQQQQRQPPRRWEAITCLIPVGKLAPANFSRSSPQEVARTSRRVRGAGVRTRSPERFPLPPSSAACTPSLSPARALPPPASPPSFNPLREAQGRGRGGCRQTPTRAAWTCTVSSGRRGQAHAVAQLCLCPPVSPAIPARGCGVGLTQAACCSNPTARAGAGPLPEELRRHAEPPPGLKPLSREVPASSG